MAWLHSATRRPIPEAETQSHIDPTQHVYHVSAGQAESLFAYWTLSGIALESHLHTGWQTSEQYMPTDRRADANVAANERPDGTGAISEESAGLADGLWTPYQLGELIAHGKETHELHGIPLRICRDPDDPGYGWHAMWGMNTRDNPDVNPWTLAIGKVCPGPNRILQLKGIVLPAVFGITTEEIDDMFSDADRAMLQRIDTRLSRAVGAGQTSFEGTIAAVLGTVQGLVNRDNAQDAQLRSIAGAIGDTKSAVLAGIAAMPLADLQLSDAELDTLARSVVDDLREAGVTTTVDEVLAAIVTKLGSPVGV